MRYSTNISFLQIAAACTALSISAPVLSGIGFRIPNQDAFATGRANAFVATADNPSAVYYNPAGLINLEGTQVSAGVYLFNLRSQYRGPDGEQARNRNQTQPVPHAFFTHRAEESPFAFGVGLTAPFGLANEWPDDTPFRTKAIKGNITYVSLMPAAALELTPTLSIGGGPTFNYGEIDFTQGTFPGFRSNIKGDDTSVGYHLGIFWQPHPRHAFGANYRSRETLNLRGSADIQPSPPLPGRQKAQADFPLPEFFVVGYSYRPSDNWNFEFNIDWTRWSRLKTVTVKQRDGTSFPIEFNWKSSTMYNFGVTRYWEDGYRLSGGYTFSENSIPTEFFNPVAPDADRHLGTIALGRSHDRISWDVSLQYGYSPTRRIPANPEGTEGSFRTSVAAAIVTVDYSF